MPLYLILILNIFYYNSEHKRTFLVLLFDGITKTDFNISPIVGVHA